MRRSLGRIHACVFLSSGIVALGAPTAGLNGAAAAPDPMAASTNAKIPAAGLQEDAKLLKRCFDLVHPGLYRYNTPEQLDRNFDELLKALSQDRTRAEAFIAFTRFAASIRCGHTFANPYNQGKAAMADLAAGRDRVPFCFRWIDRKMIVTSSADWAGVELAKGSEIVSINGTPVVAVLEAMMPLARADGANDAKRISQLEIRGEDRYEIFDFLFPILFPVEGGRFTLEVRAPGASETSIVSLTALSDADRKASHERREAGNTSDNAPLWTLERRGEDLAYLRMPTWVTYHSAWDWKASIRAIFDELAESKTPNLIIDLRGNEGGTGIGDEIIARLIASPVPWSDNERFVRYAKTPAELNEALDTWDDSFRDRTKEIVGEVDLAPRQPGLVPGKTGGFFLLRETDDNGKLVAEGMIEPVGPRYTGRVFVLVNADNSSATFSFVKMAQQLGVATIVGEPTGGNHRGINGGAYFFVRLPASGLEVDLPQIGYYPKLGLTAPRPDSGVIPDILVNERPEDIASGRDASMETVLTIIGGNDLKR